MDIYLCAVIIVVAGDCFVVISSFKYIQESLIGNMSTLDCINRRLGSFLRMLTASLLSSFSEDFWLAAALCWRISAKGSKELSPELKVSDLKTEKKKKKNESQIYMLSDKNNQMQWKSYVKSCKYEIHLKPHKGIFWQIHNIMTWKYKLNNYCQTCLKWPL